MGLVTLWSSILGLWKEGDGDLEGIFDLVPEVVRKILDEIVGGFDDFRILDIDDVDDARRADVFSKGRR